MLLLSVCAAIALPSFSAPTYGNPLSANLIYLDFTTVPSTATLEQIDQTMRIVAAAFNPFDVKITSDFPGIRPDVAWVRIGSQFVPDPTGQYATLAGQSPVGVWHYGTTYSTFGTLFSASVYADGMANDPTLTGHTIIHEIGHQFGLNHETDGYMAPIPVFDLPPWAFHWTPEDVAFLGHEVGFYGGEDIAPDTAEPGVLLVMAGLVWLLGGRGRAKGSNGHLFLDNRVDSNHQLMLKLTYSFAHGVALATGITGLPVKASRHSIKGHHTTRDGRGRI